MCWPSPIFKPGNLRCVKFDSMLSRLSPTKGVKGESDQRGLPCMSIFLPPHPLSSRKFKKIPKITFSSISPYSHNISFSPSSLHFRPDFSLLLTFSDQFSLLPIVYLPPPFSSSATYCTPLKKTDFLTFTSPHSPTPKWWTYHLLRAQIPCLHHIIYE